MANLRFNMDELRPIIAHAEASKGHAPAYGEKPQPGLFLVKDSGIYLMSTGKPGLMRADNKPGETKNVVVYALGFRADGDDWYDKCHDAVGGDDFAEVLPLEWFTKARDLGATSVTVNFGRSKIGFSYALPKKRPSAVGAPRAPILDPSDISKKQADRWVEQEFAKVTPQNAEARLASERRMMAFISGQTGARRPISFAAHELLAQLIEEKFLKRRAA